MDRLKLEILKKLFYHLGLPLDAAESRHTFVLNDDNLTDTKLALDVEGETTSNPVWAAELPFQDGRARVIVSDLSDEDFREFAVAFQFQDLPQYGVRLSSDPEDPGDIRVRTTDGQWIPATTLLQASILAGFEQLSAFSPLWAKCKEYSDLYESMIEFLQGEEVHAG